VQRLIGETEMGTLFKALALTGPGQEAPAGFESLAQP
jgi:SAM-dependent MidA family methyltransferase